MASYGAPPEQHAMVPHSGVASPPPAKAKPALTAEQQRKRDLDAKAR